LEPELSIIIVSYNVRQLLLGCIQSVIDTTTGLNYEIIVVDNASADKSADAVKKIYPQVKVITNNENVGFARANNQGLEVSIGDFLLLLNPDTVVKSGAIRTVLEFMKNTPDAGLATCRLLNPNGSLQKSIRPFPTVKENLLKALFIGKLLYWQYWKKTYYKPEPVEIDYCTGAFMMVRRQALGDMPLLNPEFFMYAEEKDLAFRLKKLGWNSYFVPFGEVIHYGGASTNQMPEDMYLELYRSNLEYFAMNYGRLQGFILSLGLGVELLSYWFISAPLIPFRGPRYRFKLYSNVLLTFPGMMKKYIRKRI
jgi:GT2 family glycosyltransferase